MFQSTGQKIIIITIIDIWKGDTLRMKNKIKKNHGFTLAEMLVTVILVGLASAGLVSGVSMGTRQYNRSIRISESQQLYTTIESILNNELRFTNRITLANGKVDTFYSQTYALEESATRLYILDGDVDGDKIVAGDKYGQIAIGNGVSFNRILGKKSYADGLGAKATISYNQDQNYFSVDLSIGVNGDSNPYIEKSFTVRALENIQIEGVAS